MHAEKGGGGGARREGDRAPVSSSEKANHCRCLVAFIGIIKRAEEGGQEGEICLNYSN